MMIARRADLLTIRVSRAIALRNLGRYNEAIDDFHAIAPLLTQLLGPRAPATLAIHMLYAQALHGLGRYEQALREIDTFGPMQADVIGELHHDVLTNRLVRAMALKGLGRSDEARTEVLETIARLNRATDPTGGLLRAANLLLGNEERQPSAIPARSES
jgi:tetratricopeptide (TPR) repeat protein